jgi:hypothetical protein
MPRIESLHIICKAFDGLRVHLSWLGLCGSWEFVRSVEHYLYDEGGRTNRVLLIA